MMSCFAPQYGIVVQRVVTNDWQLTPTKQAGYFLKTVKYRTTEPVAKQDTNPRTEGYKLQIRTSGCQGDESELQIRISLSVFSIPKVPRFGGLGGKRHSVTCIRVI